MEGEILAASLQGDKGWGGGCHKALGIKNPIFEEGQFIGEEQAKSLSRVWERRKQLLKRGR